MITTIHHNLSGTASKQILKSVIGSLNATAIAYARGHLRFNAVENIADRKGADDVPTIDDLNDALADEAAKVEGAAASAGMGFDIQMPNDELCERLMLMRNYLADKLNNMAVLPNDKPLTIAETVKFQCERTQDMNAELVEQLAIAVDIDPAVLKEAKLKMIEDDRADLVKNAGKIIGFLDQFEGRYHEHDQIEEIFDGCPAHVQYKLIASGVRAHDRASDRALTSLLRGRLDAATDIKLLKASKLDLLVWLKTFAITHQGALNAYIERGGSLPALEDNTIITAATERAAVKAPVVVQAPVKPVKLAAVVDEVEAPASQDKLIALSQSKLKQEPKAKGAPRRAKKATSTADAAVA